MKTPVVPIELDIEFLPTLNYPLVKAYVDPDVELDDCHINCIYDAIDYAKSINYGN